MPVYNARLIEEKWQKRWEKAKLHEIDLKDRTKPKYYNLAMFPYPSGDKLHIGHWYNFAPADSWGRYMRMKGHNVLEPMGFDSFGLPAENYAIKTGAHPGATTEKNIEYMRKQLRAMGTMYDWSKEVITSHSDYYKWTQWVFLQMYKKKLAYRKKAPVNWCLSCQTVLANEQVQEGKCERCGNVVTQKNLSQWFFKITEYAENLLDHSQLDWPKKTVLMQKNWIGKSEGLVFRQKIKNMDVTFETYNSVPQMAYADTFYVIAPEHPLVEKMVKGTKYERKVMDFVTKIKQKKVSDRFIIEQELDGIFTGRYVEDPLGNGDLPIWVASYVVAEYGTGIVKCSAHDARDFKFAKKYGIPLKVVLVPKDAKRRKKVEAFEEFFRDYDGILIEPEAFKGKTYTQSRELMIEFLEKKKLAKRAVQYKLRDWLISRQRYWGAPIPIIHCPKCGDMPVPEKDLPVLLPENGVDYKPKGKSPLASVSNFVRTECPKCKVMAEREADTMDTFVDSSWYFLRYLDAHDKKRPFDAQINKNWLPVDMYIGGPEHACMHLLYARFIHKVLVDDQKAEPFARLVHQGLITKNGAKMSKSKGNVVSPDAFVEKYGSDIFRMYMMFMGPFTEGGDWHDQGITGIARFVERFYIMATSKRAVKDEAALQKMLHQTIKKVTKDIEKFHFNTAVAALMEFVNAVAITGIDRVSQREITKLAAPLAPHLAEQVWEELGEKFSIFDQQWPSYDEKAVTETVLTLAIQVNGKLRGQIEASLDMTKEQILALAKSESNVKRHIAGKKLIKEIYVQGKLVSLVVE